MTRGRRSPADVPAHVWPSLPEGLAGFVESLMARFAYVAQLMIVEIEKRAALPLTVPHCCGAMEAMRHPKAEIDV